ncbi:hypothetical protein BC938DRAFT_479260 [Jimgerdemannia flammicorona]|uniref:Uncharacterized protein n=1 Tax=Jimgerdemannia flammicorona TaxID=994334 RepID=A0A433QL92_9FUNG|nr:hypothetical protein BC938DRAFT_479260 [Jimgerdemannia flammicorona]
MLLIHVTQKHSRFNFWVTLGLRLWGFLTTLNETAKYTFFSLLPSHPSSPKKIIQNIPTDRSRKQHTNKSRTGTLPRCGRDRTTSVGTIEEISRIFARP